MRIRMTDAPDYLGDVANVLTEGKSLPDIQKNFRAEVEKIASKMGHEIEWIAGAKMDNLKPGTAERRLAAKIAADLKKNY